MSNNTKILSKRVQIDKSQATIVSFIATAVFVSIFSLVSAKSLLSQSNYQLRVIAKKEEARNNIEKNVKSVNDLVISYKQFTNTSVNMLDGDPLGKGEKDGDNARLVLDALPSKYDFPALISSLEKVLSDKNFKPEISGIDEELQKANIKESDKPVPVEIPFSVTVNGSVASIQDLINTFETSIRPFNVLNVSFTGGADDMKVTFNMKTYFQPEKSLRVNKVEVK